MILSCAACLILLCDLPDLLEHDARLHISLTVTFTSTLALNQMLVFQGCCWASLPQLSKWRHASPTQSQIVMQRGSQLLRQVIVRALLTCLPIVHAARLWSACSLLDMTFVLHAELRQHWRQLWSRPVSHNRKVV